MKERPEPTAISDPEGYLSLLKFNRRIICPKTGLPISYSDIGDPDGVPLLWLMPSGCSRWFAASQDPLAKRYRVRLIAIDRPGVGATPMVPLIDRIRLSCEMMVSVLEHLQVKLAHVLATSAGVYYALYLLLHHPHIFLTALDPPPSLYLIAPWSPLLPSTHPDYYPSAFTWIPDKLIETQHMTMPHLMKVAENALSVWENSTKVFSNGLSLAKSFLWSNGAGSSTEEEEQPSLPSTSTSSDTPGVEKKDIHANEEGMPIMEENDEEAERSGRLWGKCPCCVGCTTTEYFHAENYEGVGQEHLQCLNRGTGTGHEWFESNISSLAKLVRQAQVPSGDVGETTETKQLPCPLDVQIWWGWQDGMVPRKGQLWLNKAFRAYPDEISVGVHDVPDGDHTDLLGRIEGIHQVYGMIWEKGNSTGPIFTRRAEATEHEKDE